MNSPSATFAHPFALSLSTITTSPRRNSPAILDLRSGELRRFILATVTTIRFDPVPLGVLDNVVTIGLGEASGRFFEGAGVTTSS